MDLIKIAEKGYFPTWLIRVGIRNLVNERLLDERENYQFKKSALLEELKSSPVAIETDAANEQHYEVPSEFFKLALGKHLKYSCCYWPDGVDTLDESEAHSLKQVAERARIEDGMKILELGCGWGSFTLWAAENFPNSTIKAVSNSSGQRRHIMAEAEKRNLSNVEVITCDMNKFQIDEQFDRIVSIEMLEHMRNYQTLFEKISTWLKPEGKFFVHVFSHKDCTYKFETRDKTDWMSEHFFTGGIMPSHDLLPSFDQHLKTCEQWHLSGVHYQKTAEAWLQNIDNNKDQILKLFADTYGKEEAKVWKQRWRIFMLACAELFGYENGSEWGVSHYLFERRSNI